MHSTLFNYFSEDAFFDQYLFGFQKGVSAADAVFVFLSKTAKGMERSYFTASIFCDLTKAFDCMDRKRLLIKLKLYGVGGVVYNRVESYLSNRF